MTMNRRRFLASTLPLAGAAAGLSTVKPRPADDLPEAIERLESMKPLEPPSITDEERRERCERARRLMAEHDIDGTVMLSGTSMRYFTDVEFGRSERTFALVIPRRGDLVWICPAFEKMRALERIGANGDVRTWQEHESPYALIASALADRGIKTGRVGLEETTYYSVADGLSRDAPVLEIVSADPITRGCRATKSAAEIALIRHANRVTYKAYEAAFRCLEPDLSQSEFAGLISAAHQKLGYRGGALVLFGENSAYPHGTARDEKLRDGMVVLADGGTQAGGYRSDITRTMIFGQPGEEAPRVWRLVKEAQSAALAAARPGVAAGRIDQAAREVISRGGYGPDTKYFTHRLGHGIGMDGHEWHYLVRGNETPVQPGMTFSNEPGIYIPGRFGVRLEDIMVITENGAELMTPQAREPTDPFGA